MQIADGEYEIDLLVLLASPEAPASLVAIRYGFIPDSMDQKAPLRLYQNDQVCILEAQLVEKTAKSGLRAQPIIFEGVPQGQRLGHSSANMESYFLLFVPKPAPSEPAVELRRLGSVIRVSKSRNTDKWRTAISEWKEIPKKHDHNLGLEIPRPSPKPKETTRPNETHRKKEVAKTNPTAQKRPPTATPEQKDIISVSDFEDLDSSTEDAFPVFGNDAPQSMNKDTRAENAKFRSDKSSPFEEHKSQKAPELAITDTLKVAKQRTATKNLKEKRPTRASKTTNSKPKPKAVEIDDMDDEFKDLEDQLQEVLVDSQPMDVDSSSDEDSDNGRGPPIVIRMNDDSTSRPTSSMGSSRPGKKPMSLRELYGGSKSYGGKNDDGSSSEEE